MPTENTRLPSRRKRGSKSVMSNNRAVGYARLSQATPGLGSLSDQTERIRLYCQMTGLELVDVISETISGARPLNKRPGGRLVLASIANSQIAHVVAHKLDRIFRNSVDAMAQVQEWDTNGIALHLVDIGGSTLNTKTATGKLMLSMLVGFAEMERSITVERTTAVIHDMRRRLKAYGHTPFGFNRIGDALQQNPDEMAIIRQIRRMRKQGRSLRFIAGKLNSESVSPKRGGKRWYASTVSNILQNEFQNCK